ncbi:LysR substrate-binding domain-containing protein [Streptomyces sp. NPDC088261]|uniref:LysR substrate-binding domain-containing protein n=1 Tax=Streptomyces sp. NPDC088261 TaxID=3365851 RepID=UPI0037FEA413
MPAGHRLADRDVLDLADLADEPWVGSEPLGPCLEPVLTACAAAGFTPDFVVESGDYASAQGFVAAGLGIGVMPLLGVAPGTRHPGVVVCEIRNPQPVRAICAAVREASLTEPALRALVKALRDAAKASGARPV